MEPEHSQYPSDLLVGATHRIALTEVGLGGDPPGRPYWGWHFPDRISPTRRVIASS